MWNEFKTQFQSTKSLCEWISSQLDRFDLRVVSIGWTTNMKEELLRTCSATPSDELQAIDMTFARSAECIQDQCRDEFLGETHATLMVAGEKVFHLSTHLPENDAKFELSQAIEVIQSYIQTLESDRSFELASEMLTSLTLPLRLPRMMNYCLGLFKEGKDEQLARMLSRATTTPLNELGIKEDWSGVKVKAVVNAVKSWWFSSSRDKSAVEVCDAFRHYMQVPLETMKQSWCTEVTNVIEAHCEYVIKEPVRRKMNALRHVCKTDRIQAIDHAFVNLLRTWETSNAHGLRLSVTLQSPPSPIFSCTARGEELLPPHYKLHVWSLGVGPTDSFHRQLISLGEVDLVDGEVVLAVFTIQSRSVLVVSLLGRKTQVLRVVFDPLSSRPRQLHCIRTLPHATAICEYNNKGRLIVLGDADGKVGGFRLDDQFQALEPIRTFDISLKTSLELPLNAMALSDGLLHMIDCVGAVQSLNTRNYQTSRKDMVYHRASLDTHRCRLFRAADGGVLGWLNHLQEGDSTWATFIAADDMRELPQSVQAELPRHSLNLVCDVVDDSLYMVDPETEMLYVIKLEASLKSDTYRTRSLDVTAAGSNETGDETHVLSQHWLWAFYHLYEKFPVRGELFRGAIGATRQVVELSFVCDVERTDENSDFDDGCLKLLGFIMEKLQLLNKPLYGLDLAGTHVAIGCGSASQTSMMDEYGRITPHAVTALLRELVTFVPVQICRAEFNSLTSMTDGQAKPQDDSGAEGNSSSLGSADIALKLRFGLLSPLLSSWSKQCIVVTSMGKQSTGKSYFLNHLTGSSFAISGARCTDGAWMSVRFLPSGAMLVVVDFEGLGSFERTEQEDVFLSVLNASVSMLTIFRMEMRLDKEIDELFSKFQKGSQLIKNDPQLFRGKLYMSVKDVNPNDQRGVVGEFVTKFQRLLEANKKQNFLTDMYAGQLGINCSPPLGSVGYYRSLSHAQRFIDKQLCGNPKAGFPSGKAFLDCVRLLLAKVSILDWTSLDESTLRMKIAELAKLLPSIVRYGYAVGGAARGCDSVGRGELLTAATGMRITTTFSEVCAANPSLASKWQELAETSLLDQVNDEEIDLGLRVESADSKEVASAIQNLFSLFLRCVRVLPDNPSVQNSYQLEFDSFLSYVIRRRCLRVYKWSSSAFADCVLDGWSTREQKALSAVQNLFVRCHHACSQCQLGCMKASVHCADGDHVHDCATSHECEGSCVYCSDAHSVTSWRSQQAGHEGRCECDSGDHTCGKPCVLALTSNCGKLCAKKACHDDPDDHRCSVGLHKCGKPCMALECSRLYVVDMEVPHTAHKCEVDHCIVRCVMTGCNRTCNSLDHFHGHEQNLVATVFSAENPDGSAKQNATFDASSQTPAIHM